MTRCSPDRSGQRAGIGVATLGTVLLITSAGAVYATRESIAVAPAWQALSAKMSWAR